jgi:hypothetical protein
MLFIFYLIGGFYIKQLDEAGLGNYALNINSLINPLGWSKFMQSLSSPEAFESLNYIGLGVILLIPVAAVLIMQDKKIIDTLNTKIDVRKVMILVLFLSLIFFSLSPIIHFGNRIIFEMPLPHGVINTISIFRVTARLFWPIYYLIIIGILSVIIKKSYRINPYLLISFLFIIASIQLIDIRFSDGYTAKLGSITLTSNNNRQLSLDKWKRYIGRRRNLVYLDEMNSSVFFEMADISIHNNYLSINNGYFARSPQSEIWGYISIQKNALKNGVADMNNIYITKDRDYIKQILKYKVHKLDGYYLIGDRL